MYNLLGHFFFLTNRDMYITTARLTLIIDLRLYTPAHVSLGYFNFIAFYKHRLSILISIMIVKLLCIFRLRTTT